MRQPPKKVNRDSGLSVAIVGLRFGAAFVPIYLHHPDVANVGIIDPVRARPPTAHRVAAVYKVHCRGFGNGGRSIEAA